jgi:hypothetical protein
MASKKNGTPAPEAVVHTLSASEVDEIIEVCLCTPMEGYPRKLKAKKEGEESDEDECMWGLPVLIEGEPGIAKTARVKQLGRTVLVKVRSLFAAQHPPEDFSGALIPDGKGSANQVCPLTQIRELIKEERGIIFLDEINGAPPATQGAVQSFIHERVAGDQKIPGRIRVIAAQNPAEIATGGFQMSPPLANRFVHITDPGPTSRDWITYIMGTSSSKLQASLKQIEEQIIDDWPNLFPESLALFAGFMEAMGSEYLHKRPPVSHPQSGKAWPSHRTWDYALRGWTTARILEKSDNIRDALVEACVGPGAATAFLEYARQADIPKPLEVIEGKWQPDKDRLDIVFAAYTGAVAYVRQRPARNEKMEMAPKMWKALKKLFEIDLADLAVPAAEGLIQEQLARNSQDPVITKAANEVLVLLAKSGLQDYVEDRA